MDLKSKIKENYAGAIASELDYLHTRMDTYQAQNESIIVLLENMEKHLTHIAKSCKEININTYKGV